MCVRNQAAAELFGLLSAFWQPPDERFRQSLSNGAVDAEIIAFARQAGFPSDLISADSFQQNLPSLDALKLFYLRCFIGIGKQSALPVESIYKKWTTDPTARLPIAGNTGYLMGDSALHAQYLLNHYQLQIPQDYRMMPDHLLLLLELLAFLLENRPAEESRVFLTQHFDWLDLFYQAVDAVAAENPDDLLAKLFYQLALQTLQKAIHWQLATDDQLN